MRQIRAAIMAFVLLVVITGMIYPLIVTEVAKVFFPFQASGSLVKVDDKVIGSLLIGQDFTDDKYLWGRISATENYPYNPLASGGANYGPTDYRLINEVKSRLAKLKPDKDVPAPVDLVTSSASGLDPEISIASAYFQMGRIAKARKMTIDQVQDIINDNVKYPLWGFLGEARVNVLQVNLDLDKINYKKD